MILTALEPSGPLHFNDLGHLCDLDPDAGEARLTVATPRSGFDLEYYLNRTAGEKTAGGYYLNAAQQGEPDGRWFGKGAEALGLADGQVVTKDPYLAVYNMIDPRTGERLPGRAPGSYAKFADILQRKLAAEPHATHERYLQLEREAAQETRKSPVYTDITIAHNKSVSVLHASFREQARRARLAGDSKREALWRAREERVQEILQEANHAALEWMQEQAGFTRTGYHGRQVDGVEPGRWARANLVVTSWLQGTNRNGEPHDHSHNVIARMAQTESDGVWRAVDTMALRHQLGAMAAIVESRVYSALAREFGVKLRQREDGRGHEIDGITQQTLDAYSTRARTVTRKAASLARQWAHKYGRAPNAREMLFITDEANLATRDGKDDEPIDWDALAAKWDATIGGELAAIAENVCDFGACPDEAPPSQDVQEQVIREALARVQTSKSTWNPSDLMRSIAWSMGQEFSGMPPAARQDLLVAMTGQALSPDFGVVCLEAPEWPPVPRSLIRDLDGRSVYTRPGTTRYATRGQLDMEERLCQQAQRQGAPALTREFCAAQLGADADTLDAQLGATAQDARQLTHTGLRMDQAAMTYEALTSKRRVSVGVGPAGAGKTHTAAVGARAWEANGGRVIGLTCAQSARDVLAAAGIRKSFNTTKFLLEIERGMPIAPGTLFVIDEGSMVSTAHLAQIIDLSAENDCKVFLTGDHQQLTAVESGGGMTMLANYLGYTKLAVPVRFQEEWERDASLRLRTGDKTALDAYAEHGPITGGSREDALDQARKAYVAGRLAGQDVLLMAHTREDCRELSRLIRDDLIHLGLVDGGPSVQISDDERASTGDVIVCRKNDNRVQTDPGHKLTNGDVFRVESVQQNGAWVRRVLEPDPETGQPRLANCTFFYGDAKLREAADLAYAVTGHKGMGGTVQTGLAFVTGKEPLEWLYVALSRGRERNTAIAVTHDGVKDKDGFKVAVQPREADPRPGTRPDPALARHERMQREREGLPPEPVAQPDDEPRDPIAVLADCMDREDTELSASEYRDRALANADHLGVLHSRWADLASTADQQRYHQIVTDALPPAYRQDDFGPQTAWLYRTLRAAEMAGLDAREVVQAAVNARTLAGARNVAAVVDERMRKIVEPLVPLPQRPWTARPRQFDDPEIAEYEAGLRRAMDARAERLGEHAVQTSPAWALQALGPVPDDPVQRLDWQHRASKIATYRELYGIQDDHEVIGAEPTGNAPEMRAAWHDAFAAITKTDELDVRSLPDQSLTHMRDSYRSETGWAPPHVGKQLREVRLGAETMRLKATRAEAEAKNAKDQAVAARHAEIANKARALESQHRQHETILSEAMEDRRLWDKLTESSRRLAIQADSELRRRHPDQKIRPLESAEPRVPQQPAVEPDWLTTLNEQRRVFRDEMEARQNVMVPSEDPEREDEGPAWSLWEAQQDAILQPPKAEIKPAEGVLEVVREHDDEREGV
jgi:conjugative relaxase-like TrwC/TraI family protein